VGLREVWNKKSAFFQYAIGAGAQAGDVLNRCEVKCSEGFLKLEHIFDHAFELARVGVRVSTLGGEGLVNWLIIGVCCSALATANGSNPL
jgi:hypothetical protein